MITITDRNWNRRLVLRGFKFGLIVILFLLAGYRSEAGNNEQNQKKIQLIYSTLNGKIRLRWIPGSMEVWDKGKKYGYFLEKRTLREKGEFFKIPKTEILTSKVVLPVPFSVWEQAADTNNYAAIISEAFFGKSFQLYSGNPSSSPGATLLNKSKELNDRFAFSLLAADFCFEAAKMAGWGFVDDQVSPDGVYEYILRLNDPENLLKVNDSIRVNMFMKETLPAPYAVDVKFEDKAALISWQNFMTDNFYCFYLIEKSVDGSHFQRLNKLPFIPNPTPDQNGENSRSSYTDSIPNNIVCHYRIRGISRFGDIGPSSEVISGFAQPKLKAIPNILGSKFIDNKKIRLEWIFDPKEEGLIEGFEIMRSESALSDYVKISGLLPPTVRTFETDVLMNNYFMVKAVGKDDVSTYSGAQMVQMPDFIPPAKPHTPTGTIDTTGVVRLEWEPNADNDLDGYFVYAGHQTGGGFVKLNPVPIRETHYVDSINVRLGNEQVLYTIVAVDKVFNNSVNSDPLILQVPDVIKPSSPIFSVMSQRADSVNLKWINSISPDVAFQLLYRKSENEAKWKILVRFDDNRINSYTDTRLQEGKQYSYLLLAVDDAGLESIPTKPVTFTIHAFNKPGRVEKFTARLDQENLTVLLKWKNDKTVKAYQLYKEDGEEGPYYFETIDTGEGKFTDTTINPFKKYTYRIRSVGFNGLCSDFEMVTVNWE